MMAPPSLPAFPLRLLQVCSDLRLHYAAAYHEEVIGQAYIGDMEQARCVQGLLLGVGLLFLAICNPVC